MWIRSHLIVLGCISFLSELAMWRLTLSCSYSQVRHCRIAASTCVHKLSYASRTYFLDIVCNTPQEHGCRGSPITFTKMWILASYANLRIQFSIYILRGRLYTHGSKNLSIYFISNWVVINHQKGGDWKCNQTLIMGFGDNDHVIRELMRFIEMTSREFIFKDATRSEGAPITI